LIREAARQVGIPAAMVKAVIHAESAFDVDAVSRAGALGLMQLMPGTARELGVLDPLRAEENVHGGARYLRTLHDRYGSWTHTLAAYNAGPTAVDRYRGVPPYGETQQYVRRVLTYYRRYHADFSR
jgi:soluble lytic murein transglycosylase-like protein